MSDGQRSLFSALRAEADRRGRVDYPDNDYAFRLMSWEQARTLLDVCETAEAIEAYISDLLAGSDPHLTLREGMYAARDGLRVALKTFEEASRGV